jgi:hypothetical protein
MVPLTREGCGAWPKARASGLREVLGRCDVVVTTVLAAGGLDTPAPAAAWATTDLPITSHFLP